MVKGNKDLKLIENENARVIFHDRQKNFWQFEEKSNEGKRPTCWDNAIVDIQVGCDKRRLIDVIKGPSNIIRGPCVMTGGKVISFTSFV